MQILIDGIHLGTEMKGVGLYVLNSIIQISSIEPSIKLSVAVSDKTKVDFLPKRNNIQYVYVQWKNHFWHGFITLPLLLRQLKPDIVWIPYETPAAFLNSPFVMLCHDIPEKIKNAQAHRWKKTIIRDFVDMIDSILLRRTFHNAQIVFANSNVVANWLKDKQKINSSKILLAPCAPGADFRKMSQKINQDAIWKKLDILDGYILTFYTGDPRENIEIVPKIYHSIVKAGFPCGLVVAGLRQGDRPYINRIFSGYSWSDRVRFVPFLGVEKIAELAEIYTAALVYLEVSLHEGFGMQVVEAMACGVPVVCSNRGALPEVAGDAAYMVDPVDIGAITTGLIKVLSNQYLRDKLVRMGFERASAFSWEKTAQIIYHGLVESIERVKHKKLLRNS
jgi:glycosyltransferase involved in cell wall biosynthesis